MIEDDHRYSPHTAWPIAGRGGRWFADAVPHARSRQGWRIIRSRRSRRRSVFATSSTSLGGSPSARARPPARFDGCTIGRT